MAFYVGQKVVCRNKVGFATSTPNGIKKGKVYTNCISLNFWLSFLLNARAKNVKYKFKLTLINVFTVYFHNSFMKSLN